MTLRTFIRFLHAVLLLVVIHNDWTATKDVGSLIVSSCCCCLQNRVKAVKIAQLKI